MIDKKRVVCPKCKSKLKAVVVLFEEDEDV